ncbi:polysaccharide deacetylase family protein [Patescibacteria group bacterium]
MKICFLLHFYQPHNQQFDILDRVVNESYRPLLKGLLKNKNAKVTINVSGVLTKLLLENGYKDVIEDIKKLAKQNQIEFTSSSMHHAFLPLLQEEEIKRQIELNDDLHKEVFGDLYNPKGFFSPEMAVNPKVLKIVLEMGYKWIAAPQIAKKENSEVSTKIYKDKDSGLHVFFRNKRVSALILSAVIRDVESLLKETKDLQQQGKYWFCVMDAETFGHHRIGHEKVLFDILNHMNSSFTSELDINDVEEVSIRPSTWTNEEQDYWLGDEYTEQNSFILWKDPSNPIHKLQWELLEYVLEAVRSQKDKETEDYKQARELMDKAIASDQFWWASAKPWWSLEMIEFGAYSLKEVLVKLGSSERQLGKADDLYRKIMDQAFEWQRTGHIRKMHLENSSTYMKEPFNKRAPAEWYNQIILEFEDEMKKAAEKRDFEKAIKWRDAILKLKQGTDIYDVLHIVNELWTARQIPSVKPYLEHDPKEFSDFAKKNFRQM